MGEWAVELKDVKKTYRTGPIEVPALRGVSLQIAPGEFVAAAGPSGSGKTTLLNIIGGLDRADTGEVRVAGQDLQLLSSGALAGLRLRRIGFDFQTYNLMPVLTALENAEFTLLLQGMPARKRKEKVHKLFSEIGLDGLEDRRPAELPAVSSSGLRWLGRWLRNPRSSWRTSRRRIWTLPLLFRSLT